MEYLTKIPLERLQTEWSVMTQTLLKQLEVKEGPSWFGYEEILLDKDRILKVTAITDCCILYGQRKTLLECMPFEFIESCRFVV